MQVGEKTGREEMGEERGEEGQGGERGEGGGSNPLSRRMLGNDPLTTDL